MRLRLPRRVVGVAAVAALASLAWSGALLTWRYRPDAGGSTQELPSVVEGSRRLVRWHAVSLYSSIVAVALWCALTVTGGVAGLRRAGVVVGSTAGAMAMVALSATAWNRVRWHQLGLWAVTVGEDHRGLWYAAFSDDVRFVFVAGSGEQVPADLAPWVVIYLIAPFLALLLLTVAWLVARPAPTPRRVIVAAGA